MTESMHRTLAVLKLPKTVPALLGVTRVILASMEGNPRFPAPTPPLAMVAAALAELDEAQIATLQRTHGTTATRDEKREALLVRLRELCGYVQRIADGSAEEAAAIIESAGMSVKRPAVQSKPPFAVKQGRVSGAVRLEVRSAGDRIGYAWQWSTDGGASWRDAPRTMQAKTEIAGLPLGKMCWFRFRVLTKEGEQGWAEAQGVLVT
jgi:hypothetical protein